MILNVVIDDKMLELSVPEDFVRQAEDFFTKMDSDMDRGWQVEREWVDHPDTLLRAQIAANKLLTALENNDHKLGRLMAGYIVSRVPDVESVHLFPAGETRDHRIDVSQPMPAESLPATPQASAPGGLNKMDAMAQAAKEVSRVFKMGKQYRFSIYNHETQQWEQSPAVADKAQAEAMRDRAFKARFEALAQ